MEQEPILNQHNKREFPPMHTAEHVLNATMVRMFGCGRHVSAHVERTKSKLDYDFPRPLADDEVLEVERRVNEVIMADLPVVISYATQDEVADRFDLERLPDGASEVVRIVSVGDYDECLCAGDHVEHTAQIGTFRISSTRYQDGRLRIVFRLTT
ncbi:MAG: hypothetical protein KBT10_07035 [Bacteroidales bacterium]|nr:hypothetical protein [Candidatus Sodaliphilus aphodohippi]